MNTTKKLDMLKRIALVIGLMVLGLHIHGQSAPGGFNLTGSLRGPKVDASTQKSPKAGGVTRRCLNSRRASRRMPKRPTPADRYAAP